VRLLLILTLCLTLGIPGRVALHAAGQQTASPPAGTVTLDRIMADPDWLGNAPEEASWGDEGKTIYFRQKRQGSEIRDLKQIAPTGGASSVVPAADLASADSSDGAFSQDGRKKVYVHAGDIFIKDVATGQVRQLTRTAERESDPQFMVGEQQVSYRAGDHLFTVDLANGLVRQAADVRLEDDPAEPPAGFDYLKNESMRIFSSLREAKQERDAERQHAREQQAADPSRAPLPFYLGHQIKIVDRALSPAGDRLMLVTEPAHYDEGRQGLMARYVTESGYTETSEMRTKVNRNPPAPEQIILLDLKNHTRHDLDLGLLPGIKDDPLAALRKPAIEWHVQHGADRAAVEAALKAPAVRPVRIDGMTWSPDGQQVAIEIMSIDNKDRWIATVNFSSHTLVTQHRLTDPAWINWSYNDFGWMHDSRAIWYLSEQSGSSQLYVKPLDGSARELTSGHFEVDQPQLGRAGTHFYYRANVDQPGIYEIYRVAVSGGPSEQLTHLGGMADAYAVSPDETRLLVTHSTTTRHDDLYVQPVQPGAQATQITDTMSEAYKGLPWVAPQIVPIPSTHVKQPIYTRVYTPKNFNPKRKQKYAGVIFVHGAGYLQDAHQGWSYYFREFMFQTLLTQHGYVVIDMDYRASQGYGRDWRTAIYENMGHPELEDLLDGVSWMVKNKDVDPKRVGVYGGSYGGFMTLMAMFRAPDTFAVGAAIRPVSDWAHYNHEYTSDILNTPAIDPMAYERSDPIFFADGLRNPLLICHGMQDNNVFFQDTVRLVEHLMELKKASFETAFFPLDSHDFTHATSWLYEYRRIFDLFQRTIGEPERAR
jgi:dipeptidyl aminopeptidase/acylaminoacyl peptidase